MEMDFIRLVLDDFYTEGLGNRLLSLDQSQLVSNFRGHIIEMNCTRPTSRRRLTTVEFSWDFRNTSIGDHTASLSSKYMFSSSLTELQSEGLTIYSDKPENLVDEWASVLGIYLIGFEQASIESLKSKHGSNIMMEGKSYQKSCKVLHIVGVLIVMTTRIMSLSCLEFFVQFTFLIDVPLKSDMPLYLSVDSGGL